MRTLSTAWKNYLDAGGTALAMCIKVTLQKGTVYGFTTASDDITYLGVVYKSMMGITPSAIDSGEDMAPGNLEAVGFFAAGGVLLDDVRAGWFNNATHETIIVRYDDLSMGHIEYLSGPLGQIKSKGNQFTFELKDWLDRLTKNLGEHTSPYCRYQRLGQTECGVKMKPAVWTASTAVTLRQDGDAKIGSAVRPSVQNGYHYVCTQAGTTGGTEPTWLVPPSETSDGTAKWLGVPARTLSGTVTAVTSRHVFSHGIVVAANFWKYGIVRWVTGPNAGLEFEVLANSTPTITTYLPTPSDIGVGDTFEVEIGCNRSVAVCHDTFFNVFNFGGEPNKPSADFLMSYSLR